MTTIHLGIIDIPYSDASYAAPAKNRRVGHAKRGKVSTPRNATNQKTTGDVAEILERQYHVMEVFYETHEDMVISALEKSMEGALQNLVAGAPATISVSAEAESEIEATFKNWLSQRGMDGLVAGVPTQAARRGVSHRFLHPYAKRGSRPSFIDTGLYVANMKVWVDN